jgi:tetratricopeptide (TPR) repeat protein
MTNRFSFLFILQFLVTTAFSQEITRHDADSLIKALNKSKQDAERIALLLNLAEFHMFKPGEFKNDLDSAAELIGQARQMNAVLKSREGEGHILLEDSYLANEYKDRGKGKQLLEEAIRILEKEKNYYLLGRAYRSLGDYFDITNSAEVPYRMDAFKRAIAAFNKGGNIELEAATYGMLAETDSADATTEEGAQ